MPRLTWGDVGEHFYETGVDRGVLYIAGQDGVAWNGLLSIDETPSGGESKAHYLDGVMYLQLPSYEEFAATISSISRPSEFLVCEGIASGLNGLLYTRQTRQPFGLCYRSLIGNDVDPEHGYILHIIYNALASPSNRSRNSLSDAVNPSLYNWNITAKPIIVEGHRRTAHIMVDSTTAPIEALIALEDILYGSASESARLPLIEEIQEIFGYIIVVTDNGDGTFTVSGPDELVQMLDPTTFQITSSSAIFLDPDTYEISST